jgi:hypothetical protein
VWDYDRFLTIFRTEIETTNDKPDYCFIIKFTNAGKIDSYLLSAATDAERLKWVTALKNVVFGKTESAPIGTSVRDEDWYIT